MQNYGQNPNTTKNLKNFHVKISAGREKLKLFVPFSYSWKVDRFVMLSNLHKTRPSLHFRRHYFDRNDFCLFAKCVMQFCKRTHAIFQMDQ